jgi:hypothetical protein
MTRSYTERRRAMLRLVSTVEQLDNRAPVSTSMGMLPMGLGWAGMTLASLVEKWEPGQAGTLGRPVTGHGPVEVLPFTVGRARRSALASGHRRTDFQSVPPERRAPHDTVHPGHVVLPEIPA